MLDSGMIFELPECVEVNEDYGRSLNVKKFLLSLMLAALCGLSANANEVLNLAVGEWAPFLSEKNPKAKRLETVVMEAFKLEGVNVKFSYFPWKRSYNRVKEGSSDGTFPWNKTPDREAFFVYSETPVLIEDSVYFHLKSLAFDWKTIEDLKKYKVGVTLGFINEKLYKEKGISADSVPSEEMNFKKIVAGRIDVYETSKVVGYETINKILTPDEARLLTHHPNPVGRTDYFMMISKKHPNAKGMADKFDSGLRKLKASGRYEEILAQ